MTKSSTSIAPVVVAMAVACSGMFSTGCSTSPSNTPATDSAQVDTAQVDTVEADTIPPQGTVPADTLPPDTLALDTTPLPKAKGQRYREVSAPTPNIKRGMVNPVEGVVLHHTAEPTIENSIHVLQHSPRHVGTHVIIDLDGTRYIMCRPNQVTFHAGKSTLNDKDGCNYFTVGIEFQGNTLEAPLTLDQIKSAIEWLGPLIAKYHIPIENIVTHEMVRNNWNETHPDDPGYDKVDITPAEYDHFMRYMKRHYDKRSRKKK